MLQIQFNHTTPNFGDQLILTQHSGFLEKGRKQIQYEISLTQLYEQFIENSVVFNQNNKFSTTSRIINNKQTAIVDEANWLAQEIASNLFFLDFCRNQLRQNLRKIDQLIFNVKFQLLERISTFQNFLGFDTLVWGQFAQDSAEQILVYLEQEIRRSITTRGQPGRKVNLEEIQLLLLSDPDDTDNIKLSKLMLMQLLTNPYYFMQRGLCSYFIQKKRTIRKILQSLAKL